MADRFSWGTPIAEGNGDDGTESSDEHHGNVSKDTFDPFVPLEGTRTGPVVRILTFRAILLGSLCGALVNASNIYLGLRVGWTSSANVIGAVVGFSVLKRWAARSSHKFGQHENNIVQTVATASGGMSHVFISALPALYQLGLLQTPVQDFFRIVLLTAVGGYFGLLSIVPLRKFFIQQVARDLNLVFPSSMATALTIQSMHSAVDGASSAGREFKATVYAFAGALALRVASQYAIGLLWDWHIFAWMANANIAPSFFLGMESWGWVLEWSPAMVGSGMLVDFGVACSFLAGSTLAWGVIGPYLVAHGIAFGRPLPSSSPGGAELMSYTSMSAEFASASHPSPRYWLLWPGVACNLAVAFVGELAFTRKIKFPAVLGPPKMYSKLSRQFQEAKSMLRPLPHKYEAITEEVTESPETDQEGIATWMWAPGLTVVVVLAMMLTYWQFDMTPLESVLALILAFCMSLVAIQATGATDTTPLNAISMVSQVVLSGITSASGAGVTDAQRLNLLGASLTNIGANQGVDLIGDFRVGYLLQTPARLQYAAQLMGTLVATMVAPSVFVLFSTAYPCLIARSGDEQRQCEFAGPSVAAWRAVAVAASEPTTPIPKSSAWFSVGFAAVGGVLVLVKRLLLTGRRQRWQRYLPNMMIMALAFTLPSPQNAITMMLGAIAAKLWKRRSPDGHKKLAFAVAAGLVAGEGIGGTVNCMLSIVGIGGQRWATGIGCPAGKC
ncbi:OPT oligopeptide transporter protein-domain-containing protein [Xylariomycetidae sp. FL0641]|nr:OPT oligopeptide transporter protein-domain-containing protein [Xylariomycetidae sp. FL0641]